MKAACTYTLLFAHIHASKASEQSIRMSNRESRSRHAHLLRARVWQKCLGLQNYLPVRDRGQQRAIIE
eukprot:1156446-Pelagomonas_calceolata.AAC.12